MMARVLDIAINGDGMVPAPDQVITHSFSVGGYLTGQLLRILDDPDRAEDRKRWHALVKGQVYDSPPDMRSIPAGIGASMGMGSTVSSIVAGVVGLYLESVKNTAGREHAAASHAFHNNHIPAPSLWLYSKADPVALEEDIITVMRQK